MRRTVFCLSVALLALAACAMAQLGGTSTCKFQKVQIQTHSTYVYGINHYGAIVGAYNPTSGSQAAFILQNGTVNTIFYPQAAFTSGYGINDNGAIVGAYAMTLTSPDNGFRWANGKFTTIAYPGALATYATGINIHGQIVGSYQDSLGVFHGYSLSAGKFAAIDYPGAASTVVSQINGNGEIVGSFNDSAGVEHGFIDQNGSFTQLDYPGAADTATSGVNDTGVIVGVHYNSTYSQYDGFIYDNGTFQSVSDPADPTRTAVNGINKNNVLVGNLDDTGVGFKATGCQL